MQLSAYDAEAILCFVSAALCLLTGFILLLFSARNKANVFLGLSYLAFAMGMTMIGLIYSRFIFHIPYFYRTGNIFFLVYMPLSWLYIRSAITNKPLSAWHLLHLLPALIYIVDFIPFFLSPTANKLAVINAELNNLNQLLLFKEGWFFPGKWVIPARTLQMAFYIYNGFQVPMFLPTLIVVLIGSHHFIWVTSIPPAAASLLSALTLLLMPQVLYNINIHQAVHPHSRPKAALDAL
jgi:hypothetical protein